MCTSKHDQAKKICPFMGFNPGCRVLCVVQHGWWYMNPFLCDRLPYKTQAIMGEDVIVDPSEQ